MPHRHIRFQVRIAASICHNAILHDIADGIAMEFSKIPASLGPLACRRSSDHGKAGTDRGALVKCLREAHRNTSSCMSTTTEKRAEDPLSIVERLEHEPERETELPRGLEGRRQAVTAG